MNARTIGEAVPPVVFLVGVVGLLAIALGLCDCKAPEPGTLPAYCTDDKLYTAALLRCVDKSDTLAQSKQCREAVDYSCGIVQTITVTK